MTTLLTASLPRVFWVSFVLIALFIPFSIAGATIAVGIGALAWLVLASTRSSGGVFARASVRTDPIFVASLLLVASAIPSVLASEDFTRAFKDWKEYWMLLIYFLVAMHVLAANARRTAYWTLVASATLSSVVGLVEFTGGADFWFIHIEGGERASSTLFTMTFAAIMYQLVSFNFATVFAREWTTRQRVVLWACIPIHFAALVLTMTRGAWVAVVAGLITVGLLVRNRTVLVIAVVAIAGFVAVTTVFPTYQGRNMSLPGLLTSTADYALGSRFVLWDVSWEMFKSNPIFGVGFGDFSIEADKLVAGRETTTTVDAHNAVFQVMATRGLVGLLPFLYFWVALFRALYRDKRRMEKGTLEYQYIVGSIGATVAILAGSLTELNIDDAEVFIAFMFLLGLARSPAYRLSSRAPSPRPPT